jgi:RNAse (barnase) inhibitor barstar
MNSEFGDLMEPGAGGVFRCHRALPDTMLRTAVEKGFRVVTVGLAGSRDKNAFLNVLAKALAFPEHFGHNWDAFYDCLLDLEQEAGHATLLVLRDVSGFARAEPEEFAAAVDALMDAAEFWDDEGKSLLAVAELDSAVLAPDLPELNVT